MQIKNPSLYDEVKFEEVELNNFYILGVRAFLDEYGCFMKISFLPSKNALNLDNCSNDVDSLVTINPEEKVLIIGKMEPKLFHL